MNNLAVVFESRDRYAEAVELTVRGIEQARRVGDRDWEHQLLIGSLSAYALLGRWEEAVAIGDSADFDALGVDDRTAGMLFLPLVEIACWRGDADGARALLERFTPQDADDAQAISARGLHQAMVLRIEGDGQAALAPIQTALEMRSALGAQFLTVKLSFVEALGLASDLGDTARAEELLETIESMRPGERPPMLEAHVHRFRSKLTGDEPGFKAAADDFRELEMPFWLAVTLLEHGELLRDQGSAGEAEPLFAEATEIFERLRAVPWIGRAAWQRPELSSASLN